jgi:chromosome segregation protein
LMSIFKSKPSPFCILDEVDAPLDEANNVRFGLIVQEFLELSQFIIITHHKRTMQIANTLYGVTQQEQGVSKRVAVKFDQVQQGGRISDAAVAQAERAERFVEQSQPLEVEETEHACAYSPTVHRVYFDLCSSTLNTLAPMNAMTNAMMSSLSEGSHP